MQVKSYAMLAAAVSAALASGAHAATITGFNADDWQTRAFYYGDQVAHKPTFSSGTLNLTTNSTHKAYVAWYENAQTLNDFSVSFTPSGSSEGLVFIVQSGSNSNATSAIGAAGGNWGVANAAGGAGGILNAYGIQIFSSALEQASTNASGTLAKSGYDSSGKAGARGNPMTIAWDADTKIVTITGGSGTGFTKTYTNVDLATKLGSQFYFGFAGSNGGSSGVSTISNFSMTVVPEPAALSLLGLPALIMLRRRRA
jgi:hypothetical protein